MFSHFDVRTLRHISREGAYSSGPSVQEYAQTCINNGHSDQKPA